MNLVVAFLAMVTMFACQKADDMTPEPTLGEEVVTAGKVSWQYVSPGPEAPTDFAIGYDLLDGELSLNVIGVPSVSTITWVIADKNENKSVESIGTTVVAPTLTLEVEPIESYHITTFVSYEPKGSLDLSPSSDIKEVEQYPAFSLNGQFCLSFDKDYKMSICNGIGDMDSMASGGAFDGGGGTQKFTAIVVPVMGGDGGG